MQPSSPLPVLKGRANSTSDDTNNNNNDSSNDDGNVGRLQQQQRDDNDNADNEEMVVVGRTDAKDWKKILNENLRAGQCIDPIPYTPHNGDRKCFNVKISDEELKGLIDKNNNLWYHCVHTCIFLAIRQKNSRHNIALPAKNLGSVH